jgi:hypothetical protein
MASLRLFLDQTALACQRGLAVVTLKSWLVVQALACLSGVDRATLRSCWAAQALACLSGVDLVTLKSCSVQWESDSLSMQRPAAALRKWCWGLTV